MVKLCQFACVRYNKGVPAMRDAVQGPQPAAAARTAIDPLSPLNRRHLDG